MARGMGKRRKVITMANDKGKAGEESKDTVVFENLTPKGWVAYYDDEWRQPWDARVRALVEAQLLHFGIILPDESVSKETLEVKVGGSYRSYKGSHLTRKPDLSGETNERFQVPVIVLVELIAHAIATFEGFYLQKSDPSAAQRFNNPGNLRSWEKVPLGYPEGDGLGYAYFSTVQEGWRALRIQVWKNVVNRGMNLLEFFEIYAPSEDSHRPVHYAEFVQKYLSERGVEFPVNATVFQICHDVSGRDLYPGLGHPRAL